MQVSLLGPQSGYNLVFLATIHSASISTTVSQFWTNQKHSQSAGFPLGTPHMSVEPVGVEKSWYILIPQKSHFSTWLAVLLYNIFNKKIYYLSYPTYILGQTIDCLGQEQSDKQSNYFSVRCGVRCPDQYVLETLATTFLNLVTLQLLLVTD